MRTKCELFFLVVCLFGCSSDVRECAECKFPGKTIAVYNIKKNNDSFLLFTHDLNSKNYIKKNTDSIINLYSLIGYHCDTLWRDSLLLNPYNTSLYFNSDVENNIKLFLNDYPS